MKPETKNTLKEFAATAAAAIAVMVLVGTGAGCLNYGYIAEEKFYTAIGGVYMITLVALLFMAVKWYNGKKM